MAVAGREIAAFLKNDILEQAGTAELTITGYSKPDNPKPGTVVFMRAAKNAEGHDFRSDVLYILPSDAMALPAVKNAHALFVKNPRLSFMRCLNKFFGAKLPEPGIHPTVVISKKAKIGKNCHIGPYCVIDEDCVIGDNCILRSYVHLYERTILGNNVMIDSGTVIGADGFGFEWNEEGILEKFPHLGRVVVEDDVEIGANTCVDRGALNDTIIRKGAKVDNLVQVGHNVDVGQHTLVMSLALLGGSSKYGERGWIGPSSSIINQATVGDDVLIGIGANVVRNVENNTVVAGNPARVLRKKGDNK